MVAASVDRQNSCGQLFYDYYWGSSFITNTKGKIPVEPESRSLPIRPRSGVSRKMKKGMIDDIAALNAEHYSKVADPEISRICNTRWPIACRLACLISPTFLTSFNILDMYGPDVHRPGSFARNCLMARRMAERGVQYVQLMHAGWDQHNNIPTQLAIQCKDTDQPSAALVKDLEQRGLLKDTLVVWGGEFGRTPFGRGDITNPQKHGRDHGAAFSLWMAGAGVQGGLQYGRADDYGCNVVDGRVHVHDFQATLMHLMGIDHEQLTFRFQGRRSRLTDVHGHVVKDIMALICHRSLC